MKFEKEQLDLKEGITKEWIVTNGIGGYASSTVLGISSSIFSPQQTTFTPLSLIIATIFLQCLQR